VCVCRPESLLLQLEPLVTKPQARERALCPCGKWRKDIFQRPVHRMAIGATDERQAH